MKNKNTKIEDNFSSHLIHVVGAGQLCAWGSLYYSFPQFATEMQNELGWGKSAIYSGASLGMVISAICSYPVGAAIDRGQGRWVISIASLLIGLTLVFWANVTNLNSFYLVSIFMGAFQAGVLYEAAFAFVSNVVTSNKIRSSITVITLWGGFASTVFLPSEQFLIDQIGWRSTLYFFSGINIFWAIVYFFALRNYQNISIDTKFQDSISRKIQINKAVLLAIKNRVFWFLLIALTLHSIIFTVFIFHAYPILLEKGLSSVDSVKVLMVLGPIQVLARALIDKFANHVPIRWIGSIFAIIFPMVFAAIVLVNSSNLYWFMFLVACYGLSNGVFTIVRGLVVPEMLSRNAYGSINGLLTAPTLIARAIGPGLAASIWMINESYDDVLLLVIVLSSIFVIAFWMAARLSVQSVSH